MATRTSAPTLEWRVGLDREGRAIQGLCGEVDDPD
jgi:hypothetical protein